MPVHNTVVRAVRIPSQDEITQKFPFTSVTIPSQARLIKTRLKTATTPSRESHDDRHWLNARQARRGLPKCIVEARSPKVIATKAIIRPMPPSH